MPRVNPDRSLTNERNLAKRIAFERQAHDPPWSYDGLAKRMSDIGLPMQKTTIFKIENGSRRITVDEMVGFAAVFDIDVAELLVPVEFIEQREAREILNGLTMSLDVIRANATAVMEHIGRYIDLGVADSEIHARFLQVRSDPMAVDSYYLTPLPDEVHGAYGRFVSALWRAAEARAKAGNPVLRTKNKS